MEVLPVAENLEFFKSMDVLDDLDLLEFHRQPEQQQRLDGIAPM